MSTLVGASGFEPLTSRTRTVRSIRAEPRPEGIIVTSLIKLYGLGCNTDHITKRSLILELTEIIIPENLIKLFDVYSLGN